MPHYRRFLFTDRELDRSTLETVWPDLAPGNSLAPSNTDPGEDAECVLSHSRPLAAVTWIRKPGESFARTIKRLREYQENYPGARTAEVLGVMDRCFAILEMRVIWGGRPARESLDHLAPLLSHLSQHYEGLSQIDGEGYFDCHGLVLKVE